MSKSEILTAYKDIRMCKAMLTHGLPVQEDERYVRERLADAESRYQHAWEKVADTVAEGILADIRLGR